jgi:hypothetical protein
MGMGILSWIVLGLIAGFIGSKIVNKSGDGFFLDIILGISRRGGRRMALQFLRSSRCDRPQHLQPRRSRHRCDRGFICLSCNQESRLKSSKWESVEQWSDELPPCVHSFEGLLTRTPLSRTVLS